MPRPKQKVVEVLSLHCTQREPRRGKVNLWVAEVIVEAPLRATKNDVPSIRRTVMVSATDELAAYLTLVTDGV